MVPGWGEVFYDHYEKYLRRPVDREVFRSSRFEHSIQIMAFDGVFRGCRLFASLGVTHFQSELGCVGEVVLVADDGWVDIPYILANSLFYLIENRMELGWGLAVGGVGVVSPEFSRRFEKEAIYFARPFAFPPGFESVGEGRGSGIVVMGVFVTAAEYSCFRSKGARAFEALLERSSVDPFQLKRKSAL